MAECNLCELAAGRVRGLRVYEDQHLVVMLKLCDGRPARLLVVPRCHSATADGLGEALQARLLETGQRAARSLGDVGFDLGGVHAELKLGGEHVYLQLASNVHARAS